MPNHLRPLHLRETWSPNHRPYRAALRAALTGACPLPSSQTDARPLWPATMAPELHQPAQTFPAAGQPRAHEAPPSPPLSSRRGQPSAWPEVPSSGSDGRSSQSTTGMSYTESLALLILSRPTSYRTKADTDPSSFGCWTHGSKQRSLFSSLKILSILHFNQRLCSLLEYQIKFVYFKK